MCRSAAAAPSGHHARQHGHVVVLRLSGWISGVRFEEVTTWPRAQCFEGLLAWSLNFNSMVLRFRFIRMFRKIRAINSNSPCFGGMSTNM